MQPSRLTTILLIIIAGFVVGVILYLLRTVLLPFVIAMLLSNLFIPVVRWMRARRVPIIVALLVVLVVMSGVLTLLSLILFSSAEAFIEELPKYQARFLSMILIGQAKLTEFAQQFGVEDVPRLRFSELIDAGSLTSALTVGLGSFFSVVTYVFLVLLFMLFILAESADIGGRIREAFPSGQASRVGEIMRNIDVQVRQYLLTKTLISLATGTLTTIVLSVLGVDFALIWGFVAFLLNFIPNVGSIIASILPFIASLLQFETFGVPLLVILLLGGVQMLMGNVVEPRVMAVSMNLSALLVLVSLIFWGWLWGPLGMVLAVPLTSTLKIIFENVGELKPIAVLMSGHSGKAAAESGATEVSTPEGRALGHRGTHRESGTGSGIETSRAGAA